MTRLLEDLRGELQRLERIYLPATAAVLPSSEDQERARAFVLFSHAEIEWYIEKATADYLDSVCDAAKDGLFNFSSLALVAFSGAKHAVGDSLGGKKDGRSIATIFGKVRVDLRVVIDSNNGINEKSLAKILGPLGLAGKVDPAWMNDMGNLSSIRGRLAHMSGGAGAAAVAAVNPEDVRVLSKRLVDGDGVRSTLIRSLSSLDASFESWKAGFKPLVSARRSLLDKMLRR